MPSHDHLACDAQTLVNVQAPEDIEFLIKESEVITGRPGRAFAVAGADWQAYRLHWHQSVVKVDRIDITGRVQSTERIPTRAFHEHRLFEALASGQLFTPMVRCPS